jgi:hypothetical protein
MLETLLEHPFFLNRHQDAPLLNEREYSSGTCSSKELVVLPWGTRELIHVVRLLQMENCVT